MTALPVQQLIDLSVKENIVPDRYFHYDWAVYAQWQFDSLRQLGLQAQHRLLDIGCGPMRLGSLVIPYLDDGHYCGVDAFGPYLALGKDVLSAMGIRKTHSVHHSSAFDFEVFGMKFDYAIAQSVFTHLSQGQMEACVSQLKKVMRPGGKALFTYLVDWRQRGFLYCGIQPMQSPRIPSHEAFQRMASRHGVNFCMSQIQHPTQRVGLFQF